MDSHRVARRCHARIQLQPLRKNHRRTRRTRPRHPLRIRRRPTPDQPPPQRRWQPGQLPLRQRSAVAHRNRKRSRRNLPAQLPPQRPDPAGNRL
nr:hypothetical protein [Pseudomonas asgharzadehiana]